MRKPRMMKNKTFKLDLGLGLRFSCRMKVYKTKKSLKSMV